MKRRDQAEEAPQRRDGAHGRRTKEVRLGADEFVGLGLQRRAAALDESLGDEAHQRVGADAGEGVGAAALQRES